MVRLSYGNSTGWAAICGIWSTWPINLAHELTAKNIRFKVLEGHGAEIDTTTANGRLIFGIFAALAEFERELISGAQKAEWRRRGGRASMSAGHAS